MADLDHRRRAVVPVSGGRVRRQHRPVARLDLRVARVRGRNAVLCRGDRRLAVQRRDRRRQGHRVGLGRRQRALGGRGLVRRPRCRACARSVRTSRAHLPRAISLEDWGTLTVLSGDSGSRKAGPPGAQASVTALRVRLTAAHGGLPAGSEIVIGSAQATSVADLSAPRRPPSSRRQPASAAVMTAPIRLPRAPEPDVGGEVPGGPGAGRTRGLGAALVRRFRVSRLRDGVLRRQLRRPATERFPAAGTTARTSSPRRARRSSPLPTARCTRSASTGSAATGCGCETRPATSSTTRTSPPTRRSRSRVAASRQAT